MKKYKGVPEFLVKYYKDTEDGHQESELGYMIELEKGFIISLNFHKDSFRSDIGCLIHEVVHVVQYLLRNRRIPLQLETEEIYAYLTEDISKKIMMKLY